MPGAASNGFCPERFAALMARFEVANPSEAEAMNAARAMRRMVALNNLRFVDVMGRADVMAALDVQLQPLREESAEAKQALQQVTALREELTERTRNVRELAERLKQEEETNEGLRKELKAVTRQAHRQAPSAAPSPAPARVAFASAAPKRGGVWGLLKFALLVVVLILIFFGTLHLTVTLSRF
jgi:hypothetical protein